jgi:hypothetical protein
MVSAMNQMVWIWDISRSLIVPVLMQYLHLRRCLQMVTLTPESKDHVLWCWSSTAQYWTHSAYLAIFAGQSAIVGAK